MQFIDLKAQYQAYKAEIDAAVHAVLDRGDFILGQEVKEFEKDARLFVGVDHAIGMASGTDALIAALMAMELKPGDEVITPAFSFVAAAEAIKLLGGVPVFADCGEDFLMRTSHALDKLTKRTVGIIAVDLFGQCCDYEGANREGLTWFAKDNDLWLIEDMAQAFGAERDGDLAGNFGNIACTSFFPAKPLGCYGDGGMCFTNIGDLAEKLVSIRAHGKGDDKYNHVRLGLNSRLDTIQAAILRVKLEHFTGELELRNNLADFYDGRLGMVANTPVVNNSGNSVYAQYTVTMHDGMDRDIVAGAMKDRGIPTAIYYPVPLHRQPAFYSPARLPMSEDLATKCLSLPFHPFMSEEDREKVVAAMIQAVGE